MSDSKTNYMILYKYAISDLEKEVSEAIVKGWSLNGRPFYIDEKWCQSIFRVKPVLTPSKKYE